MNVSHTSRQSEAVVTSLFPPPVLSMQQHKDKSTKGKNLENQKSWKMKSHAFFIFNANKSKGHTYGPMEI